MIADLLGRNFAPNLRFIILRIVIAPAVIFLLGDLPGPKYIGRLQPTMQHPVELCGFLTIEGIYAEITLTRAEAACVAGDSTMISLAAKTARRKATEGLDSAGTKPSAFRKSRTEPGFRKSQENRGAVPVPTSFMA